MGMGHLKVAPTYALLVLLNQLRDQAGPAGLMAGTNATAVVTVEVLVEQDQIAPVRIGLESFVRSVHRSASVGAAQEGARQPARDLRCHFGQRHPATRPRRTLHREVVPEVVMEPLQ